MILIKSVLVGTVLLLAVSCGGGNGDTTAAPSEPPDTTATAPTPEEAEGPSVVDGTLHVTGTEWSFDVPPMLDAGSIEIAFENVSNTNSIGHELRLVRLEKKDPALSKIAGMSRDKAVQFARANQVGWIRRTFVGETAKKTLKVELEPGSYGLLCLLELFPPDYHASMGMFAEITVTN